MTTSTPADSPNQRRWGSERLLLPALAALVVVLGGACSDDSDERAAGSPTESGVATRGPTEEDATATPTRAPAVQAYAVPAGSHPHDVAPAVDGGVWYTAQGSGELGWLDPATGETREIALGAGSAPHGVIVGPDGAPWITDAGLNAIVRVDPETGEVTAYALPADRPGANLNTAAFDNEGRLWFTGQAGVYGRLDPATGDVAVFDAPRGRGPYGITTTPDGDVYYASLAGSYLGRIDPATDAATVIEPPTAQQGARRAWSDSGGRIWVSEWNSGQVSVYDPGSDGWRQWRLPGEAPQAYAVYVDEQDDVWLTDFGANAILRFDPDTEQFQSFPLPHSPGEVRQILGRPGELWGPSPPPISWWSSDTDRRCGSGHPRDRPRAAAAARAPRHRPARRRPPAPRAARGRAAYR